MHTILLYYHYTSIERPNHLQQVQKALCKKLGLKGRILISDQGINGTIGGPKKAIEAYMDQTNRYPGLEEMEWKVSEGPENTFPKLRVVVRKEIVTLGLKAQDIDVDMSKKAPYIEPEELQELYDKNEDFIIIDARNDYEWQVGKFKDALTLDIDTFREFPEFVDKNLQDYKQKTVVTYCTGGIRCEKASAYLRDNGFTNVRQLHGGIHRYGDKTGGKNFQGKMYVFDCRTQIDVNSVNPSVISSCYLCQQPSATYTDCVNDDCNLHFIACDDCRNKLHDACSEACLTEYQKIETMKNVFVSLMVNQRDVFQ